MNVGNMMAEVEDRRVRRLEGKQIGLHGVE
jgi:hypothetical protein